jgi:hypothetical protein
MDSPKLSRAVCGCLGEATRWTPGWETAPPFLGTPVGQPQEPGSMIIPSDWMLAAWWPHWWVRIGVRKVRGRSGTYEQERTKEKTKTEAAG